MKAHMLREIERERDREKNTHTHIYIREIWEREKEGERQMDR